MIIHALLTLRDHFFLSWFALLLFVLGFVFSWVVEKYDLTVFKVLPLWFFRESLRFSSPESSFLRLFLFIFIFNSVAIFLYMLSGAFVVFPFIIAFVTGTNIGIISQEPMPEERKAAAFQSGRKVRPGILSLFGVLLVPLLEISAFCVSMAMGMGMGIGMFFDFGLLRFVVLVSPRVIAYLTVIIPVLFLSALLEAGSIKDLQKLGG